MPLIGWGDMLGPGGKCCGTTVTSNGGLGAEDCCGSAKMSWVLSLGLLIGSEETAGGGTVSETDVCGFLR
eukprot:283974-Rhodomonas_salina.2